MLYPLSSHHIPPFVPLFPSLKHPLHSLCSSHPSLSPSLPTSFLIVQLSFYLIFSHLLHPSLSSSISLFFTSPFFILACHCCFLIFCNCSVPSLLIYFFDLTPYTTLFLSITHSSLLLLSVDEIAFLEGMTIVYKSSIDLFFYVVGSSQENEVGQI